MDTQKLVTKSRLEDRAGVPCSIGALILYHRICLNCSYNQRVVLKYKENMDKEYAKLTESCPKCGNTDVQIFTCSGWDKELNKCDCFGEEQPPNKMI